MIIYDSLLQKYSIYKEDIILRQNEKLTKLVVALNDILQVVN